MKKFKLLYFFILAFCFVLMLNNCLYANYYQNKKPIKVGFSEAAFYFNDEAGKISGMGYDLLQEISMYTSWEYEYYNIKADEMTAKLDSGEIDLMLPAIKTDSYSDLIDTTTRSCGRNIPVLIAKPDRNIFFNDFEAFNSMTIGRLNHKVENAEFDKFFTENNCHPKIIEYDDYDKITKDFDAGVIDLMMKCSNRALSNCKVVSSLEPIDCYIGVKKGNTQLLDQLNYAMDQININTPTLIVRLENTYNQAMKNVTPAFTKEEYAYIKNKKEIYAFVGPSEYELITNKVNTLTCYMIEQLEQLSGLKINISSDECIDSVYNSLRQGKCDLLFNMEHDYKWAEYLNVWLTNSYLTFPTTAIRNKAFPLKKNDGKQRVAVVKGSYFSYMLGSNKYTELLFYKNVSECIEAVYKGDAEITLGSKNVMNYYYQKAKYSKLELNIMSELSYDLSLAVSKNSDTILISIFNKCLACIIPDMNNHENSLGYTYNNTVFDYISGNPVATICVLSVIAIIIFIIAALIYVNTLWKKKNIELEKARIAAEAASKAKSSFLSRMSHEIRTPINAIMGMSEIILHGDVEKKVRIELNKIMTASKHLLSIVNDVLDISKIESDKMVLKIGPFYVNNLIEEIIGVFDYQFKQKNIEFIKKFNTESDICVDGDAFHIKQILFNFLSNAVKFTPTGGRVILEAARSINENNVKLIFTVSDTGIGISSDKLKSIFNSFEQEDETTTRKFGGTGLGLAIVKNLSDMMNGKVTVYSKKNEGSSFTFEVNLPMSSKEDAALEATSISKINSKPDLSGWKILIAEDNDLNAEVAAALLSLYGAESVVAGNGEEAVNIMRNSHENEFKIILMDIQMPLLNGYEATKQIRCLGGYAENIPIIAMTANVFDEDKQNAKNAGMNAHISKPIEIKKMLDIISNLH